MRSFLESTWSVWKTDFVFPAQEGCISVHIDELLHCFFSVACFLRSDKLAYSVEVLEPKFSHGIVCGSSTRTSYSFRYHDARNSWQRGDQRSKVDIEVQQEVLVCASLSAFQEDYGFHHDPYRRTPSLRTSCALGKWERDAAKQRAVSQERSAKLGLFSSSNSWERIFSVGMSGDGKSVNRADAREIFHDFQGRGRETSQEHIDFQIV